MSTRYSFQPGSVYNTGMTISSSIENQVVTIPRNNRSTRASPCPFLLRLAMRISRSRCFTFLRRVFHYQNGSRSDLGSNPFNSNTWMSLEFIALLVQISITTLTIAVSKTEKPVWPLRVWIVGYDLGCLISLWLLFWQYRQAESDGVGLSDTEHRRSNDGTSRTSQRMNRCRTLLEFFFAIWFVTANIWIFDTRFGSFNHAPKLHFLCITLLAWNAILYSFPFLLFLLLCCCVPLISNLLGYNMNMGSAHKGASEDQISMLPSWRYKGNDANLELGNDFSHGKLNLDENLEECCICLTKYKDKEEVRQLPCSHMFHLKCVDQWLIIISCCPLCKQEINS